ncbi:Fis family transcriptional regulator [Intrasporangium oryzae NRRL B-24470]|uniref:Fis family transcriptional regulator n=1 Tax=Intrasporangium oryzae NRRL B-24470 TaxID=1386089 RepID=W9GET4_9MICO|nr:hypothetical protein [Intrasporangium oryzae]EWT03343.1 Fis family transcriptional regulator [Intrasporangium oryzae NRRL B-24470]
MIENPSRTVPAASFDPVAGAVVITDLTVADKAVATEALRWSTGRRGSAVPAQQMVGVDLGGFVTQALAVGAQAIACAGGAQDTFELERLVADVAARTEASSAQAADVTGSAVKAAAESVAKATDAARTVIAEAGASTRAAYAETVKSTTDALRADVERIFGGESPELLAKLGPVLESVGRKIGDQAFKQTDELLGKVSRQFDPADPTSPFAKQAKTLADQQKMFTDAMDKNHLALIGKVDELAKAVEVQKAAAAAVTRTASVTPLKGGTFESEVNGVMEAIAAGLGDEYADMGGVTGSIQRCKKGDGVLTIAGGVARVVVEMHDSMDGRVWNDYLDESERNREAAASIGVVRTAAQNKGQTIRVLGARRVVLAFDPASDDSDLLRTVVQLMRVSALAASSRRDVEGLETAEEQIGAATLLLDRINKIRSASGSIRKSADAIDKECNTVQSGVQSHLSKALDALAGVAMEAAELAADPAPETGHASGAA